MRYKIRGAFPSNKQIGHSCQLLAVIVMGLTFRWGHMILLQRVAESTLAYSDADRAELTALIEYTSTGGNN